MYDNIAKTIEGVQLAAITFDDSQALINIEKMPDRPGVTALIFGALSEVGVAVDLIVQNVNVDRTVTDLSFTVPLEIADQATLAAKEAIKNIGGGEVICDKNIAKVSLEGMGMKTHSVFASRMFRILGDANVNILLISTSEMKLTCVIPKDFVAAAIASLSEEMRLSISREEVQHRDSINDSELFEL